LKAFLLAAGHGTRLRPLTNDTPKCLLPIRGVPLLQIWLQTFDLFGISEVLINVHSHAAVIHSFLESNRHLARVRIVQEPELLGSAGTILQNRAWVDSEEFFWICYADVLHQVNLSAMLAFHQSRHPVATIGVYRVPDPSRCGVVELNENSLVTNFVEKPTRPQSNLAFSGLLIGTSALLNAIPSHLPADLGFDVFPHLVRQMVAYPISNYLIDIGTLSNYELAQSTWPGVSY